MTSPHDVSLPWSKEWSKASSLEPLPHAARSCRVAIAGTITNAATGEVMPQAVVRIAAAPAAFAEGLMATLTAAIAHCPMLQADYSTLLQGQGGSPAPLTTAQSLLDYLEQPLGIARPDQTHSGGDGHYCFLDLPPGLYTLTATYTVPDRCYGATTTQVQVPQSCPWLTFAELDLAIHLEPWPLAVAGEDQGLNLGGDRNRLSPISSWQRYSPRSPRAVALPH